MDKAEQLKSLSAFMQDKGFVYGPSPEIYGGLAGFFDYGPMGKLLKNNVEAAIRKVFQRNTFFEVECPTIMPRIVWEASGHLGGFTDPLIKDKSGNSYRVDKLIEEHFLKNNLDFDSVKVDGATDEELINIINQYNIKSPSDEELVPEITQHNLMMKTTVGLDTESYNRPETATTTYLPFLRYMNFFRDKLPGGVFQIGKAYRNEISPRQYMLRMREFTQAEAQLMLFESQKNNFEKFETVKDKQLPLWPANKQESGYDASTMTLGEAINNTVLKNQAYAWTLALAYDVFIAMGIPSERIRLRQHNQDEMAFYADDAWDLEVNLNTFGWTEMCGIHDRNDYDLKTHSKFSHKELVARNEETGEKETPHILEIAFGVDRPTFALLDIFYDEKEKVEGKTQFALPYHVAPVKFAVLPLTNKLHDQAYKLYEDLQEHYICFYDKSGSVGKRYLRADSVGIPYCITYDFDTLEKEDQPITIRDRNTGEQHSVPLKMLHEKLRELVK